MPSRHDYTCTACGNVNRFGLRPRLALPFFAINPNVTVHGRDVAVGAYPTRLFLNYAMHMRQWRGRHHAIILWNCSPGPGIGPSLQETGLALLHKVAYWVR